MQVARMKKSCVATCRTGAALRAAPTALITAMIPDKQNGGAAMNPNKALWEKGDFSRIAESMRTSGEALVKTLGITKGLKFSISDAATARPPCRRRSLAPTCWAST